MVYRGEESRERCISRLAPLRWCRKSLFVIVDVQAFRKAASTTLSSFSSGPRKSTGHATCWKEGTWAEGGLLNRLVENVNGHATSEKRTTGRRQHRKHTAGGGTVDGVMTTINLDGLNGQTTATQHDKRRNTALRRIELGNQHHLGKAVKKSQPRNLNVWRTDTTAHPKKL